MHLQPHIDSMGKNTRFQVCMDARGCSHGRSRLVTLSYGCTRQQKIPLHCPQPAAGGLKPPRAYTGWTAPWGFKVPVPSTPAPLKDTYHMLSSSCQTEAYSQIQCTHRPTFFSTHHQHSPEDSIRSAEILAGTGKGLLTLKTHSVNC